jgi:hypothetical protein
MGGMVDELAKLGELQVIAAVRDFVGPFTGPQDERIQVGKDRDDHGIAFSKPTRLRVLVSANCTSSRSL